MKKFLADEAKRVDERASSKVSSATTGKRDFSFKYNETEIFHLLKLIRHTATHLFEIDSRQQGLADTLGTDEKSFMRYFTSRYPTLFTYIWVLSAQHHRYPMEGCDSRWHVVLKTSAHLIKINNLPSPNTCFSYLVLSRNDECCYDMFKSPEMNLFNILWNKW